MTERRKRAAASRDRKGDNGTFSKVVEFAERWFSGADGWIKLAVGAVVIVAGIIISVWQVLGYGPEIARTNERLARTNVRQAIIEENQEVLREQVDELTDLVRRELTGLEKQADAIGDQLDQFVKYLERVGEGRGPSGP